MPKAELSPLQGQKLLLVGGGKMGSAMLHGWLAAGLDPAQFFVQEPTPDAALQASGVTLNPALEDMAKPDIIVLAVKPQMAAQIVPALVPVLAPQTLVISLLAGATMRVLGDLLGGHQRLVRTMPNTPAALGAGVTALCAAAAVDDSQRGQAEALMSAVGKTVWIDQERDMDAVTAISGSGPAYIFLMAETMASSGQGLGLDAETAKALAVETIIGSAKMLAESGLSAAELRRNVTSPGGTTEAALDVLSSETGGLGDLMRRATAAAAQRGRDLSQPDDTKD